MLATSEQPNCAPTAFYNAAVHRGDDPPDFLELAERLQVDDVGADRGAVDAYAAELGYRPVDSITFDDALCYIVRENTGKNSHLFLVIAINGEAVFCINSSGSWQNSHFGIDDPNEDHRVPGSRFSWRPLSAIKALSIWAVSPQLL